MAVADAVDEMAAVPEPVPQRLADLHPTPATSATSP
jgi:hypothetical protein